MFDGGHLPSKAGTEESRALQREARRKEGMELLQAGKPEQANKLLQKAVDITPEIACRLIRELKELSVPYVVAPYEADAQLVYLERQGLIDGICSEDSDMLVFGAKCLLTKMEPSGQCEVIYRKDFCAAREINLAGWTDTEFRHMAIFSGCDYLKGLPKIGLRKAHYYLRRCKTAERVLKVLQFEGKIKIPDNFYADFKQADETFLYQRVFCPIKQEIVCLTEPNSSVNVDEMPYIGAPIEVELARAIAVGEVNPITKKRMVIPGSPKSPKSPSKRRISQVYPSGKQHAADRSVSSGARSLVRGQPVAQQPAGRKNQGKPIEDYFNKDRRIPLGEMDPNCFSIESDREAEAPRPLVFPLPRPYVDETEAPARPYTKSREHRRRSEPISELLSQFTDDTNPTHRRRTAGPTFQVYQDNGSSTRPPKKARLCDEFASVEQIPRERSRFFSQEKAKATHFKDVDSLLMSDDSIDEALRSLPGFGEGSGINSCKRPESRRDSQIEIFEEEVNLAKQREEVAKHPGLGPLEQTDVPLSSPRDKTPSSITPLSTRLQEFSYNSSQPSRTKASRLTHTAYGLSTPGSSGSEKELRSKRVSSIGRENAAQKLGTPRSPRSRISLPANPTPPASTNGNWTNGHMMTPLQRMGAQALQRRTSSIGSVSTSRNGSRIPVPTNNKGSRIPSGHRLLSIPALVPLPKVDVEEVEALNMPLSGCCGSEDLIARDSDGEEDCEGEEGMEATHETTKRGLDLSKFLYA